MPTPLDHRTSEFDTALAALPPTPHADPARDERYWDAVRGLYR